MQNYDLPMLIGKYMRIRPHIAKSHGLLHGAIWAINNYLDEIEYFEDKLKEREK